MRKAQIKFIALLLTVYFAISAAGGCGIIKNKKPPSPVTPPGELNQNAVNNSDTVIAAYARDLSKVDFSGVPFTSWDIEKAAKGLSAREKKPYTILVYMNGSDLESEGGAATGDLIEMLNSGLDPKAANLIIFTGGTNRWRNNVISPAECALWEITGGYISKIAGVGLRSMGDAGTLSSFIDFGIKYCPADKYGIIMWDHGGGSIAGYGYDEKFGGSALSLLKMNYAFEKSAAKETPLEFIGFDACLMASAEMAVVAAPYGKYLIASEDLEPGDGWDYGFLSALNSNPDGAALGKVIVDSFIDFYGSGYHDGLSLSVVNLSSAGGVMAAAGALTRLCSNNLTEQKRESFNVLSKKRNNTKTFGDGSPRDNECDMVDAGDMAEKLKDLFPAQAGAVSAALKRCVIYNRHNSDVNLCGLSAYYLYGGKRTADKSLSTYAALHVEGEYLSYLHNFSGYLTTPPLFGSKTAPSLLRSRSANTENETVSSELTAWRQITNYKLQSTNKADSDYYMIGIKQNGNTDTTLWPHINGTSVCMYKISCGKGREMFAVPVSVNGEDADIIISICGKYPQGRILGVRKERGFIVQKGYDPIEDGDKISFYYEQRNFAENMTEETETKWHKSKEITVKGGLNLTFAPLNNVCFCTMNTDTQNNKHYSRLFNMQCLNQSA